MSHARIHTFHATYSRIRLSCDATRFESEIAYTRSRDTHMRAQTRHARKKDEAVNNFSFVSAKKENFKRNYTNELL